MKKSGNSHDGNGNDDQLKIITVDGLEFVTDGRYRCPVTKGRYTIRPFKNPSGELIPRVEGYRPAAVGAANSQPSRYRKNFESLKEADAQRELLIREDAGCEQRTSMIDTSLNLNQVKDAEAAVAKLVSLPPPDWTDSGWSLLKAVDYVCQYFKPCRNHKPLPEAVEAFLKNKDIDCNRAAATLDSLKHVLQRLVATCPGKCVHQVSEEDLRPLIRRGTQVKSMRRLKSIHSNFFAWCAGKERSWTPSNPAAGVELPDRTDDTHIPQILPVAAVRELLVQAAKFKGGRLLLFTLVAFGCALRPSEMGRIQARRKILGKDSFHFGPDDAENYIEVIGKGRQWRKVQIPPEFAPLIQALAEAGYPIIPRNFFNDWSHLRALSGYLGSKGYVPDYIKTETLTPWVDDYPRHTGGSHHFNRSEHEHRTAKWMGNSPKMLFAHYDGRPSQQETAEFYQIPSALKLPTVAEPEKLLEWATDAELKKLKCPVDRHTTFGLKQTEFAQAHTLHLARNPDAARPEVKGFTRKPGMWTKRRMLDLPPPDELLKLFWTFPLEDLAKRFKVTRATMAKIAGDHNILLPGIGHWQQRAAGKAMMRIPDAVDKAFPEGLPQYVAPVGRSRKVEISSLGELFKLIWQYRLADLATKLNCSQATLARAIKRTKLPWPGHSYWHAKPEHRRIPDQIKHLLSLDAERLEGELIKLKPIAG
jgi:hypothetical protein